MSRPIQQSLHERWSRDTASTEDRKRDLRHLFDPRSAGIGGIAQRKIGSGHKALASGVEAQSWTHPVHYVAEGHSLCWIGKANRASKAGVAEGFFGEYDAVFCDTIWNAPVVNGFYVAEGEAGGGQACCIYATRRGDVSMRARESLSTRVRPFRLR